MTSDAQPTGTTSGTSEVLLVLPVAVARNATDPHLHRTGRALHNHVRQRDVTMNFQLRSTRELPGGR
jgi:hypothetical protein